MEQKLPDMESNKFFWDNDLVNGSESEWAENPLLLKGTQVVEHIFLNSSPVYPEDGFTRRWSQRLEISTRKAHRKQSLLMLIFCSGLSMITGWVFLRQLLQEIRWLPVAMLTKWVQFSWLVSVIDTIKENVLIILGGAAGILVFIWMTTGFVASLGFIFLLFKQRKTLYG